MKRVFYLLTFCILFISAPSLSQKLTSQRTPDSEKIDKNWFAEATQKISQTALADYIVDTEGYRVINNHQRIGFLLKPDALIISNIEESSHKAPWHIAFTNLQLNNKTPFSTARVEGIQQEAQVHY